MNAKAASKLAGAVAGVISPGQFVKVSPEPVRLAAERSGGSAASSSAGLAKPTRFLDLSTVAERLGQSVRTIRRRLDDPAFPRPVRDGGKLFVVEAELESWQARKMAERSRQ